MWKLRAILNLVFSHRFCLFTDNGQGLDAVHAGFRIRDGESATEYLLDSIALTLECEGAVLTAKEIINK